VAYEPKVAIEKINKQLKIETILAQFQTSSTVFVADNWNCLKQMQLKMILHFAG